MANFGLSRTTRTISDISMTRTGGQTRGFGSTLAWTAPERWRNGKLTSKCDVFSFGIIVWEIAAATYASVGSGDDDESTVTRPWEGVHPEHLKVKVSSDVLNSRLYLWVIKTP